MTKRQNEEKQNGCFVWLIRTKRSVNERWAKARNALRKRFYRDKGEPLTTEDMDNDTGTPDLVVTKVPVRAPPEMRTLLDPMADTFPNDAPTKEGQPVYDATNPVSTSGTKSHVISGNVDVEPDEDEDIAIRTVHESLTHVIEDLQNEARTIIDETSSMSSGAISDIAMRTVHESLTNVIEDLQNEARTIIDGTSSMSSGAISDLAEAAVSSSLSTILTETDMNQSARTHVFTPRTVSEVLEHLGVDPNVGIIERASHDMPPCGS